MSNPVPDKKLTQYTTWKATPSAGANAVAAAIMAEYQFKTDAAGNIWRYDEDLGKWGKCSKGWIQHRAWVLQGLKGSDSKGRTEIVSAVMAATHDEAPQWGRVEEHEIAFSNGVLDLRSGASRPNEPEDMLLRVVPWEYRRDAQCPLWRACLNQWLGNDREGLEVQDAFQEFFGYILTQHAKYKKCMIMPGPSDAGKSQVVYVAMALAGRNACCQLGVESMDDPVRRAVIVGKALNVMTELTADALIRDGGFKTMVSTEEPLLINEKYINPYMYIPTAKHMIATNRLPSISDRTQATYNRLLLIPFENVIPKDRQDRRLPEKLLVEMPGIAAWAVEGAKRLLKRGGEWPEPTRSKRLLEEYKRDQNQAGQFLAECCVKQDDAAEPIANLVKEFNQWSNGHRVSNRGFGDMLRSSLGDKGALKKVKRKAVTGGLSILCLIGWKFVGQVRKATFRVEPEDAALHEQPESTSEVQDHAPSSGRRRDGAGDVPMGMDDPPEPPPPEQAQ